MSETKEISVDDVAKMARLARLTVPTELQERFARQFGDILAYMDVLAGVNTENVEPLYSPVLHDAQPREDVANNQRQRDEVLQNAPAQNNGYFAVPRIV